MKNFLDKIFSQQTTELYVIEEAGYYRLPINLMEVPKQKLVAFTMNERNMLFSGGKIKVISSSAACGEAPSQTGKNIGKQRK